MVVTATVAQLREIRYGDAPISDILTAVKRADLAVLTAVK
jgi:hypothetical protein